MVIQRWDPFRELRQMDDTMNRLWRGFGAPGYREGSEDWNILMDVVQKPEELVVRASIPGVAPEEIEVAIEENVLTIKAERKAEDESDGSRYLIRERPVGTFYRELRLPESADAGKVISEYHNGVLTIIIPKAEEKKKKQIQVKVGGGTKEIESKTA